MQRQIRYERRDGTNPRLQVAGVDPSTPFRIFTVEPTWPKPFWPELRDLLRRFGNTDYMEWAALVKKAAAQPNRWIIETVT